MSKLFFHAISLTTTAKQILAANPNRLSALIKSNNSVAVYLHDTSGVTSSNGFPLAQGDAIDLAAVDGLWAIAASSSADLRIIEEVLS